MVQTCRARTAPSTVIEEGAPGNPVSRVFRRTFGGVASSTRHMFSTRALALTSSLLVVIWFAIALAYYGMIMFNTTLQVDNEQCVDGRAVVPGSDYRNVFVTTLGEVRTTCNTPGRRCSRRSSSCCTPQCARPPLGL